jgi:hypothetical protein
MNHLIQKLLLKILMFHINSHTQEDFKALVEEKNFATKLNPSVNLYKQKAISSVTIEKQKRYDKQTHELG